jgi:hypothetical protein
MRYAILNRLLECGGRWMIQLTKSAQPLTSSLAIIAMANLRKDETDQWTSNDPSIVKIMVQARLLITNVGFPIVLVLVGLLIWTGYIKSPFTDMLKSIQEQQAQMGKIIDQHSQIIQNQQDVAAALKESNAAADRWRLTEIGVLKRICRNGAQNESQRELCDDPRQYLPSPGESINEWMWEWIPVLPS